MTDTDRLDWAMHCWHASGEYFATNPPRWAMQCCRTGELSEVSADVAPRAGSGPHGDAISYIPGVLVRDFPIKSAKQVRDAWKKL